MGSEYAWDMSGFCSSFGFTADSMTMQKAERIFQLEPEPPKTANLNDYIVTAVQERDCKYLKGNLNSISISQAAKAVRST